MEGNKPLYLIKWKGYPDEENTWEPLAHLDGIKNLIAQYELEHASSQEEQDLKKSKSKINKGSKKIQKTPVNAIKKTKTVSKKQAPAVKKVKKSAKTAQKRVPTPKKATKKTSTKQTKSKSKIEEEHNKIEKEEEENVTQISTDDTKKEKPKSKSGKGKAQEKKEEHIEEEKGDDFNQNGNLQSDVAVRISDHAVLDDQSNSFMDTTGKTALKKVYFQVEFKKRKDGFQPAPSFYSYTVLKKKVPTLILDYIEDMVHFD